mmetsp:Transcript_8855/g.15952  ORF Transcript_8855/g.15952 Transcript_8855/m.15952 type:complete len:313 (+) Transcript_8855:154-1092(+)
MIVEKRCDGWNGWPFVIVLCLFLAGFPFGIFLCIIHETGAYVVVTILSLFISVGISKGFIINQPNEATVLLFFGTYVGTAVQNGFLFVNPFYTKIKISLRARSFETGSTFEPSFPKVNELMPLQSVRTQSPGKPIKVNDANGSPIDISAVIVWSVEDTAKAVFAVDDYETFFAMQSEAALRILASSYPYDTHGEAGHLSLRGNTAEVCLQLQRDVQERIARAGLFVIEARLNHLAYSTEIASAMLQRQQAQAIIAARAQIVEGAIGIVQHALHRLEPTDSATTHEDRNKLAANLLLVLCGNHSPQPVLSVNQ